MTYIHCKSFRHIQQTSLWITRWGRLMRPLNLHTLIPWSNTFMFAAWHAPKIMIQTWPTDLLHSGRASDPPPPTPTPTEQSWVWSALTLRAKPGLVPWRLPNFSNAERAQIPPARMGSALEPDTVGVETVAAADYGRRFNRRIRLSVSTHFQKHGLYSKVASLDWKSSAGLIRPPLDRPLFPFSPTNTLFSPLPSSLSFISLHLSHSLLSFSLPLPVTPAVSLSYPSPICGKLRLCACRRWVNLWRQCTHAHTYTHMHARTHTHILSPTKASVSVWLWKMQHQQKRREEE